MNETHIKLGIKTQTKGWIGWGLSIDGSMTSNYQGRKQKKKKFPSNFSIP